MYPATRSERFQRLFGCNTRKKTFLEQLLEGETSDIEQNASPTGQTHTISWIVYLTAAGNAVKNCISVPAFMIQFPSIRHMPLTASGPLLLAFWLASSAANFWIEWNKVKERLKGEFDLEFLLTDTAFKPGTLYLFEVIGADVANDNGLYYAILNQEKLEIKSLHLLSDVIQTKLKAGNFNELDEKACKALKKRLATHHTSTKKADKPFKAGERTDAWLFWKNFLSIIAPSITTGALIGLLAAHNENTEVIIFAEILFSALNFLKDMVTESVIGVSAHGRVSTTHFWNFCANEQLEKGNIKALIKQPYFNYLLCDFFLGCLRNFAPLVIGVTCVNSFSEILTILFASSLKEKNTASLAITFFIYLMSFLLYITTTSAYRIFSLSATKQLLEPAIPFNMENSLSDSKNRLYWFLGELMAARYLTVDFPLKRNIPPNLIANVLICATNIAFIALGYSALVTYLTCAAPHCFENGEGSLLGFLFSKKALDAAHPIPFVVAMSLAVIVIVIGNSSKKANILDYLVRRKEKSDNNLFQVTLLNNFASAKEPSKASKDDARELVSLNGPEPSNLLVRRDGEFVNIHWSDVRHHVDYRHDRKISKVPYATLFTLSTTETTSREFTTTYQGAL